MKFFLPNLLLFITCLALVTARGEDQNAAKDKAQLQGQWSMVSGERGGAALPPTYVQGSKRVAHEDEVTVTIAGQPFMKAKFLLDLSKKPKSIDYTLSEGPNKGKIQLGIYKIEGTTLTFCFAASGEARPSDFTTKPGDGRTMSVWKRDE
jgi:uncharacterized protein (TIGR03067 family)